MRSIPAFVATLALALTLWVSPPAAAMNKAELIDAIASKSGLSKADSKRALDGFINATSSALKKGDRISLVGFGSFSVSKRTASANACDSTVEVDFFPAATFRARHEDANHDPFTMRTSLIVPRRDGSMVVLGPNNGAAVARGDDLVVRKRPGRISNSAANHVVQGVVVRGTGTNESSYEILENGAGKSVVGIVLGGEAARDLQIGGSIESIPKPVVDEPIGPCPDNGFRGNVVPDKLIFEEVFKALNTGANIPEESAAAAYNALLDTIIDEVNHGELVDLGSEFGAFVQETVITASVADDPCAGIPENCPPDGTTADTVYPYIEFDVSAQTGAFTEQELAGLKDTIEGIAKTAARTGRNPQTGKEIKIAAKNVVKFKAGAELSGKVN